MISSHSFDNISYAGSDGKLILEFLYLVKFIPHNTCFVKQKTNKTQSYKK